MRQFPERVHYLQLYPNKKTAARKEQQQFFSLTIQNIFQLLLSLDLRPSAELGRKPSGRRLSF